MFKDFYNDQNNIFITIFAKCWLEIPYFSQRKNINQM